jgi:hypothetical protein
MEVTNRRSVLGVLVAAAAAPLAWMARRRPEPKPPQGAWLASVTIEHPKGMEAGAPYWTHNWTNDPQPWRTVAFCPDILLLMPKGAEVRYDHGTEIYEGLPDDTIIVHYQCLGRGYAHAFECVIESQEFEPVAPGERIPWHTGPMLSAKYPSHDTLKEMLLEARNHLGVWHQMFGTPDGCDTEALLSKIDAALHI